MNNKGLTLIELLGVIVILGIIILLAVPSYTSIANSIKEKHRNNLISDIEIAAANYAYDTNATIVFVDTLVEEGYIEGDDNDGNIIDPVNNERMNCYIVEMEKESNYYNATFIDGASYDNNGVCDTSKLVSTSAGVSIKVLVNGKSIKDTSAWLTGTITLQASGSSLNIDCAVNRCVWSSTSGANYTGVTEVTLDNITGALSTTYTFQYSIYNDKEDTIQRYTASIPLKINNES